MTTHVYSFYVAYQDISHTTTETDYYSNRSGSNHVLARHCPPSGMKLFQTMISSVMSGKLIFFCEALGLSVIFDGEKIQVPCTAAIKCGDTLRNMQNVKNMSTGIFTCTYKKAENFLRSVFSVIL